MSEPMSETSRRDFLLSSGVFAAGVLGSPALASMQQQDSKQGTGFASTQPATSPQSGSVPGITEQTFAEAEKLAGISFTDKERAQMARSIRDQVELIKSRLDKKKMLPGILAPALTFDPRVPGIKYEQKQVPIVR